MTEIVKKLKKNSDLLEKKNNNTPKENVVDYECCFESEDADLKIVEPFTAHYVYTLGVARFLSCAHWGGLQVVDTRGRLLVALGYGLWPSMVLISEIVQTFILADFCYYYVKSVFGGQFVLRLPSGVV